MEAEEAQDAQGVLADAGRRFTDEADAAHPEILFASGRVVEFAIRAQGQGVDGEVATLRVTGEVPSEPDHRVPAVGLDILPQGGHLEGPSGMEAG